ncbi:MAG: nitroreductase [Rhizomicrobium sp.]|jgi:nitroreductase
MADKTPLNDTSSGTLGLLLSRRSGSAKAMAAPGPNADELRTILGAGIRAPDHGKLAPWRFILFEGDARHRMGRILVECLRESEPDAGDERLAMERNRFARAPVVVAVISRVREGIPIPVWEQQLSAGAVCQNILIAAHAMGYVAGWITEWCAYDARVTERIGLKTGERIAGYIYIGTSAVPLEERVRPDLDALITRFEG